MFLIPVLLFYGHTRAETASIAKKIAAPIETLSKSGYPTSNTVIPNSTVPELITPDVSSISCDGIVLKVSVSSDGGSPVIGHGVIISRNSSNLTYDNWEESRRFDLGEYGKVASSDNSNDFFVDYKWVSDATGTTVTINRQLLVGYDETDVICYYQTFAINENGISYGGIKSFKVENRFPVVTSAHNAADISFHSVKILVDVTEELCARVYHGVMLSTTADGFDPMNVNYSNKYLDEWKRDIPFTVYEEGTDFETGRPYTNSYIGIPSGTELSLNDLKAGQTYYYKTYASYYCELDPMGMGIKCTDVFSDVKSFTTKAYTAPALAVHDVTDITFTSAKIKVDVTSDGGKNILNRGIVWSETEINPVIANQDYVQLDQYQMDLGTGIIYRYPNNFTYTVSPSGVEIGLADLKHSTTYYYRTYAENELGISYSEVKTFRTNEKTAPVHATPEPTELSYTTAKIKLEISSDGNSSVVDKGIVWSTTNTIPTQDNGSSSTSWHELYPSYDHYYSEYTTDDTGVLFTLKNLEDGKTYYYQTFAVNEVGKSYGGVKTFTTPAKTAPVHSTPDATEIDYTVAKVKLVVSSDGGYGIWDKGIVYSSMNTVPTRENGSMSTYWQSFQNSFDNGYYSYITDESGVEFTLKDLEFGKTYYYQTYATNQIGTSYGGVKTFTTPDKRPTLLTPDATGIDYSAASINVTLVSQGLGEVTNHGIVYSESINPDYYSGIRVEISGWGVSTSYDHWDGSYSFLSDAGSSGINLKNLQHNTTYYYQTFASNSYGTNYGGVKSFTTRDKGPALITQDASNVNYTTADTRITLVNDGAGVVTDYGIVWSSDCPAPVLEDYRCYIARLGAWGNNVTSANSYYFSYSADETGASITLKELEWGKTYYYQTYAINEFGTRYGGVKTFTTPTKLPAVVTLPATTGFSEMYAKADFTTKVEVSSHGASPVLRHGVLLSNNPIDFNDFYTNYNKLSIEGYGEENPTGNFDSGYGLGYNLNTDASGTTVNIWGLGEGLTYYYCSFAENEWGVAYGEVKTFTTLKAPVISRDCSGWYNDYPGSYHFTFIYTEGEPPVPILPAGCIVDEAEAWNGGVLSCSTNNVVNSGDLISILDNDNDGILISSDGSNISSNGTIIGTISEERFFNNNNGVEEEVINYNIVFNTDLSNDVVSEVARSFCYSNSSKDLTGTSGGIWAKDASGAISWLSFYTYVTTFNDPPVFNATSLNPTFTEDDPGVKLFANASLSTVEAGQTVRSFDIIVSGIENFEKEVIKINGTFVNLNWGAVIIPPGISYSLSESGVGERKISFVNTALSAGDFNDLINSMEYYSVDQNPSSTERKIKISAITDFDKGLTDYSWDDQSATSYPNIESTVTVVPVRDIPFASNVNITSVFPNEVYTIQTSHFEYQHPDGIAMAGVQIVTLPADGILWIDENGNGVLDGEEIPIVAGSTISAQNIDLNKLKFLNPLETTPEFTFKVFDGEAYSNEAYTAGLKLIEPPSASAFLYVNSTISESGDVSVIRFRLSNKYYKPVTVRWIIDSGSTASLADMDSFQGEYTFPVGESLAYVDFKSKEDLLDEADESLIIHFNSFENCSWNSFYKEKLTVTINDNDPTPSVSFTASSQQSTEETGSFAVNVELSAVSGRDVTVPIQVSGLSTAAGTGIDYSLSATEILIPAGSLSGTITVAISPDDLDEFDETIVLEMGTLVNAVKGSVASHLLTITDDDLAPAISFDSVGSSGEESVAQASLPLSLSAVSGKTITVDYLVSGKALGNGVDYTMASGTLSINPGVLSSSLLVAGIVDDLLDEVDETVIVTLSNPQNATLGVNTVFTYTIVNNDIENIYFDAVSSSGSESVGNAEIAVSLSSASEKTITIDYVLSGTATANEDYVTGNGSLSFAPGETTKVIPVVSITDDLFDEEDETIVFTLTNAQNATLLKSTHTFTIVDNDLPPVIAFITDFSKEKESVSTIEIPVSVSNKSGKAISVDYVVSGTANGGGIDYTLADGTLELPAGTSGGSIFISNIVDDVIYEETETVVITLLNPVNASLGTKSTFTHQIENNDLVNVSFANAVLSGLESVANAQLEVKLSSASNTSVFVDYTISGTATGGGVDFVLAAGTLGFPVGSIIQNILIGEITNDRIDESDETVIVTLNNPRNAVLHEKTVCTYTIIDDDGAPVIAFDSNSSEGDESVGSVEIQVSLTNPSYLPVSVGYSVSGTAVQGDDYVLANGTLSIAAGQDKGKIIIGGIKDDAFDEEHKTVIITLSDPANANLGANKIFTYKILDNDDEPRVSIAVSESSIIEASGTSVITASLSAVSKKNIIVSLGFSGTAEGNGTDYICSETSITIPAGEISANLTISAVQESLGEVNETIIVDVLSVENATEQGSQQQIITILDDDAPTVSSVSVPANGIYRTGEALSFTVTFSQKVSVDSQDGVPALPIIVGTNSREAILAGELRESTTALFSYTVVDGDEDLNGIVLGSAIALNGASIKNISGMNALTVLNGVGSTAEIKVDGICPVAPVVMSISADSNVAGDGITNHTSLLFGGRAETGNAVEVFVNTVSVGTTTASESGIWQYDYTSVALADGVYVVAAKSKDVAGNISLMSEPFELTVDTKSPTLAITGSQTNVVNVPFVATFTFNEGVSGFGAGDVVVSNASISDFISHSDKLYTCKVTPIENGQVTLNVAANICSDVAGNANGVAEAFSIFYDSSLPAVSFSSTSGEVVNTTVPIVIKFSESVSGFEKEDIKVVNAKIGEFTVINSTQYQVEVIPEKEGLVNLQVLANVVRDAAGNGNAQSAVYSFSFDKTAPELTITSNNLDQENKSFNAEFIFTEPVNGFVASDIVTSSGEITGFTALSEKLFVAKISNTKTSVVELKVAAGAVVDAANNPNSAAVFVTEFDYTPPTVLGGDTVLYLDANGSAMITVLEIDKGSHDDFGIASRRINRNTFTCSDIGENKVIFSVTDNSGNTASTEVLVTIKERIKVFTKDVEVLLNQNGEVVVTAEQINNGSFSSCGNLNYTLDKSKFSCNDIGSHLVTLSVSDKFGNIETGTAVVTVKPTNQRPSFATVTDINLLEDSESVKLTIDGISNGECYESTQQVISVKAESSSPLIDHLGVSYIPGATSAELEIYFSKNLSGQAEIRVTIQDDGGIDDHGVDTLISNFKINISPINDVPIVSGQIYPQKTLAGEPFNYTIPVGLFSDPDDNDHLGYSISAKSGVLPDWIKFDAATATIHGTPGVNDIGTLLLYVNATDRAGSSVRTLMELVVYQRNTSVIAGSVYNGDLLLEGGAFVCLYQRWMTNGIYDYKLIDQSLVSSAGSYSFYNLMTGDYILVACISDTIKYDRLLNTYYGNTAEWEHANIVTLEANTEKKIDIELIKEPVEEEGTFKIFGTIINKAGDVKKSGLILKGASSDTGLAEEGVIVILKQLDKVIRSSVTDSTGYYEFIGLKQGTYIVEVEKPGFKQHEKIVVETLGNSANKELINFTVWVNSKIVTDVSSLTTNIKVSMFPNPTDGKLNIRMSQFSGDKIDVNVFSITGQNVYRKMFMSAPEVSIDLGNQYPGVYMVQIQSGSFSETQRIVVK